MKEDKKKGNHFRQEGVAFEKTAAAFLRQKGYEILVKNYTTKYGEIDIIAREREYLVFVEVKGRRNAYTGSSLAAVTAEKQKKIIKTAKQFLYRHQDYLAVPCRFDVIGIEDEKIIHLENAFQTKNFF